MPRRLLRLPTSSDEEEEEEEQTLAQTLPSSNPPPPSNPVDILDDDLEDISQFIPPSPPPPIPQIPNQIPAGTRPDFGESTGTERRPPHCPVEESLRKIGVRPKREWLDSCISGLIASTPGFANFNLEKKAKLCLEQFLFSDMNAVGDGGLPANVHSLHCVEISGPFVLQVDEIVNLSSPLRDRYKEAPAGIKRCLKLSMTDGVQRVSGIEYRPIRDLTVFAPAGLKIAIQNVHMRRGLLMLVPEVVEVLGGLVEYLDAARQRLVHEINKPPRGNRIRHGEVPSLVKRARVAAWPPDNLNDCPSTNPPTSRHSNPPQPLGQVATLDTTRIDAHERLIEELNTRSNRPNAVGTSDTTGIGARGRIIEELSAPSSRPNIIATSDTASNVAHGRTIDEFSAPSSRLNSSDARGRIIEQSTLSNRPDAEPNLVSDPVIDIEMGSMYGEIENPIILTGDKEIPFTYLACLLAKWTANKDVTPYSQGKIKCFLTGVKSFQFKEKPKYELNVYVDDGSLISEILIDHHVVQRGIGHSPEEVTAALSSSDKDQVARMRETMKQFQLFLAKFEGTMLVEINGSSPLPIALEMNQGCSSSDAWLLLRRLKIFTAPQTPCQQQTDAIEISP